jgi:hypothetical protein
MKNTKWISASLLLLACNNVALAQTKKPSSAVLVAQTAIPAVQSAPIRAPLPSTRSGKNTHYRPSKVGTNDNRVGR